MKKYWPHQKLMRRLPHIHTRDRHGVRCHVRHSFAAKANVFLDKSYDLWRWWAVSTEHPTATTNSSEKLFISFSIRYSQEIFGRSVLLCVLRYAIAPAVYCGGRGSTRVRVSLRWQHRATKWHTHTHTKDDNPEWDYFRVMNFMWSCENDSERNECASCWWIKLHVARVVALIVNTIYRRTPIIFGVIVVASD